VLPVFGPSNVRDAFGRGVDLFTDPWAYLIGMEAQLVRTAVSAVDAREALIEPLDALRASSLDYYAALRSTYLQQRERDIRNEGSFQRRFFNWEGDTRPARQR
jgi:phospholipid-binding lipoprotein MlaA